VGQEYHGDDAAGEDTLVISRTALKPGDRVLLIDDLIATGGTLMAGVELVKSQQVGQLWWNGGGICPAEIDDVWGVGCGRVWWWRRRA
jgi:hypothetical protein